MGITNQIEATIVWKTINTILPKFKEQIHALITEVKADGSDGNA